MSKKSSQWTPSTQTLRNLQREVGTQKHLRLPPACGWAILPSIAPGQHAQAGNFQGDSRESSSWDEDYLSPTLCFFPPRAEPWAQLPWQPLKIHVANGPNTEPNTSHGESLIWLSVSWVRILLACTACPQVFASL